jgi:hypothetical protein
MSNDENRMTNQSQSSNDETPRRALTRPSSAIPEPDNRSPERRARDEQIAAEPPLPHPELPNGAVLRPIESFLNGRRPRRKKRDEKD